MSALLGRMPSAVGYQPNLATEMGELQERITSTKRGSITSVQAVYVPADDLTDPAPAAEFRPARLPRPDAPARARPRLHQMRYYGYYSNVARAKRAAAEAEPKALAPSPDADRETAAGERRRLRKLWAQLVRRVYEVDPLLCRECGGTMRILAFILEPAVIRKILAHLERGGRHPGRGPPSGVAAPPPLAS